MELRNEAAPDEPTATGERSRTERGTTRGSAGVVRTARGAARANLFSSQSSALCETAGQGRNPRDKIRPRRRAEGGESFRARGARGVGGAEHQGGRRLGGGDGGGGAGGGGPGGRNKPPGTPKRW